MFMRNLISKNNQAARSLLICTAQWKAFPIQYLTIGLVDVDDAPRCNSKFLLRRVGWSLVGAQDIFSKEPFWCNVFPQMLEWISNYIPQNRNESLLFVLKIQGFKHRHSQPCERTVALHDLMEEHETANNKTRSINMTWWTGVMSERYFLVNSGWWFAYVYVTLNKFFNLCLSWQRNSTWVCIWVRVHAHGCVEKRWLEVCWNQRWPFY